MSVIDIFKPSSRKFYVLFEEAGNSLKEMNRAFSTFIFEDDTHLQKTHLKQLEGLKNTNDQLTHKLMIELSRNFITPFDREDIHSLATSIDAIADYMYAIARQRITYGLGKIPRETQVVAEKLKTVIKMTSQALNELSHKKDLLKLSVYSKEMMTILYECDEIMDAALATMLDAHKDIIATVKLTDHFGLVQILIDKCCDMANVIDAIIVKYA